MTENKSACINNFASISASKVINFGRADRDACTEVQQRDTERLPGWAPKILRGDETTEFKAVIGPTGGQRGYQSIAGNTYM